MHGDQHSKRPPTGRRLDVLVNNAGVYRFDLELFGTEGGSAINVRSETT